METKELKGTATPEQIAMWKNMHGEIFAATVEESTCYLKKPDRNTLKAVSSVGANDNIRAVEILLENCWLGGDEEIKTDDSKFFAVSKELVKLLDIKQAELKKL